MENTKTLFKNSGKFWIWTFSHLNSATSNGHISLIQTPNRANSVALDYSKIFPTIFENTPNPS